MSDLAIVGLMMLVVLLIEGWFLYLAIDEKERRWHERRLKKRRGEQ